MARDPREVEMIAIVNMQPVPDPSGDFYPRLFY